MYNLRKQLLIYFILAFTLILIPSKSTYAETIKLNVKNTTISVGSSIKLSLNTKQKIIWTSSDKTMATVSKSGKVTALKIGMVEIKAKIKKRDYVCKIKIENPILSNYKLKIKKGDRTNLYVLGTERDVSWESTNSNVVFVENGDIVAVNIGKAEIIATINKDKKLVCEITVESKIEEISSIYFKDSNIILNQLNQKKQLVIYTYPTNAAYLQNLTWISNDCSIVSVDQNGCITALKDGITSIYVITSNGKSAECTVKVVSVNDTASISFDKTELNFDDLSKQNYLFAQINSTTSIYPAEQLKWKSSNDCVAIVDNLGLVKPIGNGKCIITADTPNGKRAECLVNVQLEILSIYNKM